MDQAHERTRTAPTTTAVCARARASEFLLEPNKKTKRFDSWASDNCVSRKKNKLQQYIRFVSLSMPTILWNFSFLFICLLNFFFKCNFFLSGSSVHIVQWKYVISYRCCLWTGRFPSTCWAGEERSASAPAPLCSGLRTRGSWRR